MRSSSRIGLASRGSARSEHGVEQRRCLAPGAGGIDRGQDLQSPAGLRDHRARPGATYVPAPTPVLAIALAGRLRPGLRPREEPADRVRRQEGRVRRRHEGELGAGLREPVAQGRERAALRLAIDDRSGPEAGDQLADRQVAGGDDEDLVDAGRELRDDMLDQRLPEPGQQCLRPPHPPRAPARQHDARSRHRLPRRGPRPTRRPADPGRSNVRPP
ncbi:MAG: hypothetical protein U0900_09560 [Myxococcota bacterium]